MTLAFRAGVPPWRFWDLTYRELTACLRGSAEIARDAHKLHLFGAYQGVMLTRQKRPPPLADLLRKLDPRKIMSPKALRAAIIGAARAMGAKVTIRGKAED